MHLRFGACFALAHASAAPLAPGYFKMATGALNRGQQRGFSRLRHKEPCNEIAYAAKSGQNLSFPDAESTPAQLAIIAVGTSDTILQPIPSQE